MDPGYNLHDLPVAHTARRPNAELRLGSASGEELFYLLRRTVDLIIFEWLHFHEFLILDFSQNFGICYMKTKTNSQFYNILYRWNLKYK